MKKDYMNDIKSFGLFLLIVFVILKLVYFKESIFVILKLIFAYLYLYLLPGYLFLFPYKQIKFSHKLVLGFGVGLGLTNLIIYLLSFFFSMSIYTTIYLVPAVLIILGLGFNYYKRP